MDEATMRARVDAARVARLATVTADGRPHVVPCCFVRTDETIWSAVDAKPKSTLALRRLDNLRAHHAASLVIDHYEDDWDRLWWVRLDGEATVLGGDDGGSERSRALDALAAKYPQYVAQRPPGAVISIVIGRWRAWP